MPVKIERTCTECNRKLRILRPQEDLDLNRDWELHAKAPKPPEIHGSKALHLGLIEIDSSAFGLILFSSAWIADQLD